MAETKGGYPLRLPKILGKGEEDEKKNYFLYEAIWNAKGTTPEANMIKF
jgi:hypothetical protein